jgi:alkylated DNA repair dioxygenase AlkB
VASDYYDDLSSANWQEVKGSNGDTTRHSAWYVNQGCSCSYVYGQRGKAWEANIYPNWLVKLTALVAAILGIDVAALNSANLNKYSAVKHDLYWHSDNETMFRESELARNVDIFSLSFGASRTMSFRRKYTEKNHDVVLNDGDLCTMQGRVQDFYQHTLRPASAEQRKAPDMVRYNITWRTVKRHTKGCQCRS